MNLQQPNANEATQTPNRSRSVVPSSGICTRCIDGCRGNCEVFKSTFRGREVIYPGPFGTITAGGDKDYPVDYSHLNILGYALGAEGLPEGSDGNPGQHARSRWSTPRRHTASKNKVKLQLPIITGALGSTEIARATGSTSPPAPPSPASRSSAARTSAASTRAWSCNAKGKIVESPEHGRRVETYRAWHEGYGDILVQMNVEDTRFGVAEYAVEKLGVETHRAQVGPGRQVHRRRDQGRLAGARPGAAEARLPRHPRPLRSRRTRQPSRTAPSSSSSAIPAWALSTRKASCRKSSACASSAPSASRSRPAPTPCASWPWRSSGPPTPRSTC